jgi:hypothetical protein
MKKLSGIAACIAVSFALAGAANASQVTIGSGPIVVPPKAVFTTPDVNFVTHGATAIMKNGVFSLTVNSALGDLLAIDNGKGFAASNGTLIVNSGPLLETSTPTEIMFGSGGTVTFLADGKSQLVGQLGALTLTQSAVGFDYLAGVKATSGALAPGFSNGGGFFGLLYNVKVTNNDILANGFTANAKGDIAAIKGTPPAVPEPATLALMAMGISGLFVSARRRIV